MGQLLKGATLIELEPATVEVTDLRIAGGRIAARGQLVPADNEEVIDLRGRCVMPGLVSAHHHLYATLLRGTPLGVGFAAASHRLALLEDALELDDVQAAATAGGLEGLLNGTTTVFDLHSSPRCVLGSLTRVAHGLNDAGMRAVLSYEVSERSGAAARDEAIEESATFASRAKGRFRGSLGVRDLHTLSDAALAGTKAAIEQHKLFVSGNLAEDAREEGESLQRFGKSAVDRLVEAGLVGPVSILAQGVHLAWPDLSTLISLGPFMAHAARSNMATQTGLATAAKFGVRACVATDIMSLDALAEVQVAWLRSRDAGQPIDPLRFLANGQRLASEAFGATLGMLRENALADLVVLDYQPAAPLDPSTLAAHVLFGLSARNVESVMVDGMWRLWKRKALSLESNDVARAAAEAGKAVWSRATQREGSGVMKPPSPAPNAPAARET